MLDEDWIINIAEEKWPHQTGYVIATRRLTEIKPGKLLNVENSLCSKKVFLILAVIAVPVYILASYGFLSGVL